MKTIQKIKYLLSSLLLLVCIHSCSDLDQEYFGHIKDEDLWNSKTDFDQAINGAVRYLDQPYGYYTMHFFLMEDAATDYFAGDSNNANEYSAFQNWTTNYPTTFSWAVWTPLYQSVYQCNLVLERLDRFPVRTGTQFQEEDSANKSKVEGQARFFRALNYYFAQNYFGGVPIVKSADDNRVSIAKSSRDEVRTFIEEDLLAAANLLPDAADAKADALPSRPSKQAAYGLLARLYINWESRADRWQKTSDACDAVINNPSGLGLEPVYADIFSLARERNKEIVFAIEHNIASGSSQNFLLNNYNYSPYDPINERLSMLNPIGAQLGWNANWQIKKIRPFSNFDPNDVRKKQILDKYINKKGASIGSGSNFLVNKYPLDPKNTNNSFGGNDQPIIRYADIILMKAEAQNHMGNLGGAINLINLNRRRAGLGDLPNTINTLTLFNDEIYNERRREFFFEGIGRTDMIRFKLSTNNTHDNEFLLWIQKKIFEDAETLRYDLEFEKYLKDKINNPNTPLPEEKKEFVAKPQTADEVKYLLYPFDALAIRNNAKLEQNPYY